MPENTQRVFPEDYRKKWRVWGVLSALWILLHYSLGILGIVLAALIPIFEGSKNTQAVFSAITVICTSLVTFLSARKNANIYLHAWRAMDLARLKYIHDPSTTDLEIQNVVHEQEDYIQQFETDA